VLITVRYVDTSGKVLNETEREEPLETLYPRTSLILKPAGRLRVVRRDTITDAFNVRDTQMTRRDHLKHAAASSFG